MKYVILLIYLNIVSAKLDTNWWKYSSAYQILIPMFKDSNDDGIGDIKGITSKLDHFTELGIDVIYLSPFFKNSEDINKEFLITDYKSIDSHFGTMQDFDELVKKLNDRGIKVLIDIDINHTGKEHEWFLKSEKSIQPYTDYYIWENSSYYNGKYSEFEPPNLWYGWNYNTKRKQFYFSSSDGSKPDLNLKNQNVIKELEDIMTFWLDKGIAGFLLDSPRYYAKNFLLSTYLYDGPYDLKGSLRIVNKIRSYLDEYNKKHGGFERIFIVNSKDSSNHLFYDFQYNHQTEKFPLHHLVFYDMLQWRMGYEVDASSLNFIMQWWYSNVPKREIVAWKMNNNEMRKFCRKDPANNDIYIILISLLPGVVRYNYGQEIALPSGIIKKNIYHWDNTKQTIQYPNPTPIMQWDESINAGFTKNLHPVSPPVYDYPTRNVKRQKIEENSHYNLFKDVIKLRKTETMRSLFGHSSYIVCINSGDKVAEVDFTKLFKNLPDHFVVEAASINAGYKKRYKIENENFKTVLQPLSAIVLSTINYIP